MNMDGKTVLVTGSTDGVGRYVAAKLAAAGAKVLIHGRDKARAKTLADPALQKRFMELGLDVAPREQQTPEGLAAFQKAEIDKWWPIIKAAGIKAQ